MLKGEWILFTVFIVKIVIHHTDGYALRYFAKKALSMCRLCCPLGTVNTLGVVLIIVYCAFLSLRTVLMAMKTGVNSIFFT